MLKLFISESKSVIGAATIVGSLAFVSRFVGFIRDRILAGEFGAGDTLDVYYAAFKIPDLIFGLIVVGALSASFIPIFLSRYSNGAGKEKAWAFTNNSIHAIGLSMLCLTVVVLFFAEPLSIIIAPGFPDYKIAQVADLTRIIFIAQAILAVSMVYGSVLQGLRRFMIYSLAPIFYNAGIIIGAVWLTDVFGIIGLALGVVLGALLHLCVQIIGVVQAGYRHRFFLDICDPDLLSMLKLMPPRTLGIAIGQLLFLILSVFASTMAPGSVTIFQFAYNIEFFAVGIFGVSLAIAAFPVLSDEAVNGRNHEFVRTLISTTRQIFYVLIPMTLIFLILRAQIVRVVVGAGEFDWGATILTADTLAFFALTMIPQSLVFVLSRAFFALKDTSTPLVCAIASAIVGILSALWLEKSFGVIALSIGYSFAAVVQCGSLWALLRQKLGSLSESELSVSLMKITTSGLVCGVVMQFVKPVIALSFSLDTFLGVLCQGFFAALFGLSAYVFVNYLLGTQEQRDILLSLRKSLLRKAEPKEVVVN